MKEVRYRFYLDYEKEEKCINDMAVQGWHLEKWFLNRFTFTKGEPGAFTYRNEFLGAMSKQEKQDYFELLKDSGITIIYELGGWVYMKKVAAEGPFEIYTDTQSKINYYKRMLNILLYFFFINIFSVIMNGGLLIIYGNQSLLPEFISSGLPILNIVGASLIAIPIIKIIQRKRALMKKKDLYE
ncbi:DUF2812 domain-containing protein [Peribacillus sp. NPDC097675]|uniref:DUF2812 domain-containing protein n=1 Tax=Peribacillus sp. NPDC097675 TaxID=3390618 RepID=UPI003D0586D5